MLVLFKFVVKQLRQMQALSTSFCHLRAINGSAIPAFVALVDGPDLLFDSSLERSRVPSIIEWPEALAIPCAHIS
jgi:hypothetical protein